MNFSRLFARNAKRVSAVAAPETKSGRERIEGALRRVPLLEGCPDAISRIIEKGEFDRVESGRTFIRTGDHDEDVYFLIAGRVRISWEGTTLHEWDAPEIVGELAAPMHRPRSANVTALEGGVAFLKISGTEFRTILHEFPDISKRFENRKDAMLQDRIPRSLRGSDKLLWLRGIVAIISGFAAASVATLIIGQFGILGTPNYVASIVSGIIVMLLVMILSPAMILRSVAISAGLSGIGIATIGVPYARLETDGALLPGVTGAVSLGQSFTGSEAISAMVILALIAAIFLWASFKVPHL